MRLRTLTTTTKAHAASRSTPTSPTIGEAACAA